MQEWPAGVVFLCRRKLCITPAEAGTHPVVATQMDARVPAFARMTGGMTRWARLLLQARPSIENTIENVLIAVTSERW